jgi:hypothetical protein
MRHLTALLVMALMACGVDSATPVPTTQTSTAPLCGSEPQDNGDGTTTAIGCPFEQQWENITHHGVRLATVEHLKAAGASEGVSVTNSCSTWMLGTDINNVTVFVNTTTGEVRSHGQVHPGMETSVLPTTLPLPITAQ